MKNLIKRIINRLKRMVFKPAPLKPSEPYDFDKSNPLGGGGERVDITFNPKVNLDFDVLDMYQRCHYRRYQFAIEQITTGSICGDFACGTGYGSVMLGTKASQVVGMDLNDHVVRQIAERYKKYPHVQFKNDNLLHIDYVDYFDFIVSFETIEHFCDEDTIKLAHIYQKALKKGGKLIFSTPYMQAYSAEDVEKNGFHLSFYYDEEKMSKLLTSCGFEIVFFKFQNYITYTIDDETQKKEFLIGVAQKI